MTNKVPNNISKETSLSSPIVCVGFPRWEGTSYLSSTVQLMSELAQTERVLYVDYPYTYKDVWYAKRNKDSGIPLDELQAKAPTLQQRNLPNGKHIHLLRLPPFVPANFFKSPFIYDQVLTWNARRAQKAIQLAMDTLAWSSPIIINAFNPALGNALAGKLDESQLIYYCYDEIGAAPWIARHGARHEDLFLQKVDKTIVSSAGLYASKSKHTKSCAIVKNGVDLDVFQSNGSRPKDLPEGTIIGYIGSVDSRLDYSLLTAIAKAYPECHLVFLGRIMDKNSASQLAQLPNVHLLGQRPVDQLGNYLQAFDVGLIPFVKNDLTAGIYPLKINEYLALGIPVVSTHFADLTDFENICEIAESIDDFIQKINIELNKNHPMDISNRKDFAHQNTWRKRADQFLKLLRVEVEQMAEVQSEK